MNSNDILVTIITVCYNSENYISNTIESVLNQTYKKIEYIIIDGNSEDNTIDIIKSYEPFFDGRLRLISERDEGIYDAMNKGIALAQGDIIGIINSDDYYFQDAVEAVVNIFKLNPMVDIVHGDALRFKNEKDESITWIETGSEVELHYHNTIMHPTCFVKKDCYDTYGVFNKKYKISADWELLLRFKSKGLKFYKTSKVISGFRLGGASSKYNFDVFKDRKEIMFKYRDDKMIKVYIKYYTQVIKKITKHLLARGVGEKIINNYTYKKKKRLENKS